MTNLASAVRIWASVPTLTRCSSCASSSGKLTSTMPPPSLSTSIASAMPWCWLRCRAALYFRPGAGGGSNCVDCRPARSCDWSCLSLYCLAFMGCNSQAHPATMPWRVNRPVSKAQRVAVSCGLIASTRLPKRVRDCLLCSMNWRPVGLLSPAPVSRWGRSATLLQQHSIYICKYKSASNSSCRTTNKAQQCHSKLLALLTKLSFWGGVHVDQTSIKLINHRPAYIYAVWVQLSRFCTSTRYSEIGRAHV